MLMEKPGNDITLSVSITEVRTSLHHSYPGVFSCPIDSNNISVGIDPDWLLLENIPGSGFGCDP